MTRQNETHEPGRIHELFALYIDRLNAGEALDAGEIRREHPDVAEAVIDQLRDFQAFGASEGGELSRSFGPYRIRDEIGRGGMGIVYDAYDAEMDRRVALKLLSAGLAVDERAVERFRREARIVGKLRHPNVVGVYATGVENGTPYIAMEFVDGESLERVLERKRPGGGAARATQAIDIEGATIAMGDGTSPEPATTRENDSWSPIPASTEDMDLSYCIQMARTFEAVAEGLAHAHENDVIHRDLKPSNLMLATDGSLRILDFGLARLEGQDHLTGSGEILGTPRYMSPEQARAARDPIDHRTDIYSLGATLYEVLTLRAPFEGRTAQETLVMIVGTEPASPRALNPRVPRDLETVVQKCMRKDPDERYASAGALADDLRRFARGDAIVARPLSRRARLARWTRRNAAKLSTAAVIAIVATLAAFFAWRSVDEANQRRLFEFDDLVRRAAVMLQRSGAIAQQAGEFAWGGASYDVNRLMGGMNEGYPKSEHVTQATELLERAIAAVPDRPVARYHLAAALILSDERERGLAELDRAIAQGFVPAMVARSSVLDAKGDAEGAEKYLTMAREAGGGEWADLAIAAYDATVDGRWSDAAASYEKLIEREELTGEPFYLGSTEEFYLSCGVAYLQLERFDRARELFTAVRALQPGAVEPEIFIAVSYHAEGDERRAEEVFETLYERNPAVDVLHLIIMLKWARFQDFHNGLKWAERLEPGFHRELWRTSFLNVLGRNDDALDVGKKLPELNPKAALGFFLATLTHINSGHHEEAETYARRLCELAPASGVSYAMLANALRLQRKFPEALAMLEKAVEVEPDASSAKYFLAVTLATMGQMDRAIELLSRAAELLEKARLRMVSLEEVRYRLGLFLKQNGETERAREELEKVVELSVSGGAFDDDWFLTLALVQRDAGDPRQALETLERGLDHEHAKSRHRERMTTLHRGIARGLFPSLPSFHAVDAYVEAESDAKSDAKSDAVIAELRRVADEAATREEGKSAARRLAYLRGRLLEREGKLGEALRELDRAADGSSSPLPALARTRVLAGLDRKGAAADAIAGVLGSRCNGAAELWRDWAVLSFAGGRSARDLLERVPCRRAPRPIQALSQFYRAPVREHVRWLLRTLAEGETLRIDCGGMGFTDSSGAVWREDCFYTGGSRFQDGRRRYRGEIAATDADRLYQTERWFTGASTGYVIPLERGRYAVTLHFAEIYFQEPDQRRFDVSLEGDVVLEGYAPPVATAESRAREIDVSDGRLEIDFTARVDNPKLSGIEIRRIDPEIQR